MPSCPRVVGDIYQPSYITRQPCQNTPKQRKTRFCQWRRRGRGAGGPFQMPLFNAPKHSLLEYRQCELSRTLLACLSLTINEALACLVWCYCTVCWVQ